MPARGQSFHPHLLFLLFALLPYLLLQAIFDNLHRIQTTPEHHASSQSLRCSYSITYV